MFAVEAEKITKRPVVPDDFGNKMAPQVLPNAQSESLVRDVGAWCRARVPHRETSDAYETAQPIF